MKTKIKNRLPNCKTNQNAFNVDEIYIEKFVQNP